MSPNIFLQIAYAANILILVPVCYSMLVGRGEDLVFNGLVAESEGLRLLVGSVWLAILLASVAGMLAPRYFAPVLLIQIFYKIAWLLLFVLPLILNEKPWPTGISITFAAIVLIYPALFWLGYIRENS